MNVPVICCNDSVEFAVVDDEEKAEAKMAELRDAHFEKNRWRFTDKDTYEQLCYWPIHTVSGA